MQSPHHLEAACEAIGRLKTLPSCEKWRVSLNFTHLNINKKTSPKLDWNLQISKKVEKVILLIFIKGKNRC
jgi:hypothetical protein